ncbi:MAG: amino acid permease [Victivallaceae bacterium]|nr:amino acid permease [Victivallaceae bacterium]
MAIKNTLSKSLGFADVFSISAGAMISSGIFILPGLAFAQIGPAVFLAYGLAGVCALVGTFATIELATAMPLAGGIYFYTGRSMGPLAGTVSGLLNWSAIALKSSFAIFGMSEILFQFFDFNPVVCGIALTLLFLMVNLIGTKEAALAQIIMVVLLFLAMGAYVVLGFPELKPSRFSPLFIADKGYLSLFAEAAFVFVSFGGLLDVASISEEVKNPKRNLPLGMIGAIVAVALIYVLTLIVTVGVMPPDTLSGSLTPLADAARMYYGTPGFIVITFGAMMAFVTTANAGIMAAARFPYAMGRDNLIPFFFSRTYGKRKMPLPALLITGCVMAGSQLLPLEQLVSVASTVIMLSFILTNASVIILREGDVQNYRPSFHVPFYPWTPIIGMLLFGLLIMELGVGAVKISLIIVMAGLVLYFLFGRKVKLDYALIHLIHRITKNRIPLGGLEGELREIVRSRDEIVSDEVDHVIEKARVIVMDEACTFPELANTVCQQIGNLSARTGMLVEMLIRREEISSTVLTPYVAIPHLMVGGENLFELVIVKNSAGVWFSPQNSGVKAVFFLFCTADRRNRHLKMLAAIAQIIQSPSFERRWDSAAYPEKLRDLLLLAKRKRQSAVNSQH